MKTRVSHRTQPITNQAGKPTLESYTLQVRSAAFESRPQASVTRFDVLSRIVDLIADLTLPQGEFTSELELAKLLGLPGRTPSVREALALLARDGVVQPYPQRGYFVPRITGEQAEEILLLRLSIFKAIITRLTSRASLSKLVAAEQLCAELASRGTQSFLKNETAYWNELARRGGFIFAVQNLNASGDQLRIFHASHPLPDEIIDVTATHYERVLHCITEHNSEGAIAAVQDNFELRQANLKQIPVVANNSTELKAEQVASAT